MRFGLSEGMILSAGFDGGALALLDVDDGAQPDAGALSRPMPLAPFDVGLS